MSTMPIEGKYTIEDLLSLIENEKEESIHLDYKSAGSLGKNDSKKAEITKDVSSFANSDGGTIIYGIAEENHKPTVFSFVDGTQYTKEWLENVINQIQPRIEGILIHAIRNEGKIEESIYIVTIPRSDKGPHMARDKRYYKRFNFMAEPMEDYEVKDLITRICSPKLSIVGCECEPHNLTIPTKEGFFFRAFICNNGHTLANSFKLNAYFYTNIDSISINPTTEEHHTYVQMDKNHFRIATVNAEPIYENECICIGNFFLQVPYEFQQKFNDNRLIRLVLLYPGGSTEMLYVFDTKNGSQNIYGTKEIAKYMQDKYPEYHKEWL